AGCGTPPAAGGSHPTLSGAGDCWLRPTARCSLPRAPRRPGAKQGSARETGPDSLRTSAARPHAADSECREQSIRAVVPPAPLPQRRPGILLAAATGHRPRRPCRRVRTARTPDRCAQPARAVPTASPKRRSWRLLLLPAAADDAELPLDRAHRAVEL